MTWGFTEVIGRPIAVVSRCHRSQPQLLSNGGYNTLICVAAFEWLM